MKDKRPPALLALVVLIGVPFIDGILWLLACVFAGWRFVLSPRYRAAKTNEWRKQSQMDVLQEIVGGLTGIVMSVLVPVVVWWSLRPGM